MLSRGFRTRGSAHGALIAGLVLAAAMAADTPTRPLVRAHAHNDYEHARPLLDALEQGFGSVEADIFLKNGQLLVAHDQWRLKPERTLQALYLEPLRERVRQNGGRVFRDGPTFWLLIDFKTEANATWQALAPVLETYRSILTEFHPEQTVTKAVTVVLSGNSPRTALATAQRRLAAIDGRPVDLDSNPSVHLVPWISESWGRLFSWRGGGEMPPAERERLRAFVQRAHAQGRRVRFWGASDQPAMWREQFAAGVDLLNTDMLPELARFLESGPQRETQAP